MKRTWVIHVGPGLGHELNNTISESEFYGPFTQKQAERLEKELNTVFEEDDDEVGEGDRATAMLLEEITPANLLRKYKNEPAD